MNQPKLQQLHARLEAHVTEHDDNGMVTKRDLRDLVACFLDEPEAVQPAGSADARFRVGRTLGRTLYLDGQLEGAAVTAPDELKAAIARLRSVSFQFYGRDIARVLDALEHETARGNAECAEGGAFYSEAYVLAREAEREIYPAGYAAGVADALAAVRHVATSLRVHDAVDEAERALRGPGERDNGRCAVCGWPLTKTIEDGCIRGNCSMRPRPEHLYDPERAAAEAGEVGGK